MELLSIKDKLMESVEKINSETSFDDFIDTMFMIYKIEKGLEQINNGKIISNQDLKNQVEQW